MLPYSTHFRIFLNSDTDTGSLWIWSGWRGAILFLVLAIGLLFFELVTWPLFALYRWITGFFAERMRNTAALKPLLDATGFTDLKETAVPYEAQIYFANRNNLLTPDFTRKRWYTRAEMTMLTRNILEFRE